MRKIVIVALAMALVCGAARAAVDFTAFDALKKPSGNDVKVLLLPQVATAADAKSVVAHLMATDGWGTGPNKNELAITRLLWAEKKYRKAAPELVSELDTMVVKVMTPLLAGKKWDAFNGKSAIFAIGNDLPEARVAMLAIKNVEHRLRQDRVGDSLEVLKRYLPDKEFTNLVALLIAGKWLDYDVIVNETSFPRYKGATCTALNGNSLVGYYVLQITAGTITREEVRGVLETLRTRIAVDILKGSAATSDKAKACLDTLLTLYDAIGLGR